MLARSLRVQCIVAGKTWLQDRVAAANIASATRKQTNSAWCSLAFSNLELQLMDGSTHV